MAGGGRLDLIGAGRTSRFGNLFDNGHETDQGNNDRIMPNGPGSSVYEPGFFGNCLYLGTRVRSFPGPFAKIAAPWESQRQMQSRIRLFPASSVKSLSTR
jgi:hypothetical protein